MTATSSSARYKAAREALDYYGQHDDNTAKVNDSDTGYSWSVMDAAKGMAAALRALVEPAATIEGPEDIAEKLVVLKSQGGGPVGLTALLTEAVRAGIQAAWESWEPEAMTPPGHTPTAVAAEAIESIAGTIEVNPGNVYVNMHGAALLMFDEEQIHVHSDGTTATEDTANYRTGWEA